MRGLTTNMPIRRAQDIVQDIAEAKELIELHHSRAGSAQAATLPANWEETTLKFVRVIAKERAEFEAAEELHEAASTPVGK